MKKATIVTAAALLAACGPADPVDSSDLAAALPAPENKATSPSGGPPSNAVEAGSSQSTVAAAATPIPAALRGSWGLTPGDCEPKQGDAKGLLRVSAEDLRFYESRAVPGPSVQTSPDSIDGPFAFAGEGQEWSKHMALELREGKLVRTERDPLTSYTYVRC